MWVKTGLRAQLSHFLWLLECLWSVYKHLYQITIRNQFDTLLTDGVDTSKGQTDIPYQGEHQTLTKQSIGHQVYYSETCCTTISIFAVTEVIVELQTMWQFIQFIKVWIYITYYLIFIIMYYFSLF